MRSPARTSGFSLPELLITIVILGLVVAVTGNSLLNLARRERANTVAAELAGWLDQVNRDATRFNAQAGGAVCRVTITTGDLAPGEEMANVQPAACATQNILTVPDLYFNAPTVQVTANQDQFTFTPRGSVAANDDQVLLTITVNNQRPLRCIRLVGLVGVLELGRNNQAGPGGACNEWSRL